MDTQAGAWRASLAAVAIVFAAATAALADDSGVHAFLSNLAGQEGGPSASASASNPVSAPVYAPPAAVYAPAARVARLPTPHRMAQLRPVTIRLHKPAPVVVAASPAIPTVVRTTPAKVSIFEDTTLRPGDAVMMADGVKIFAGSKSWPYAKSDFVSLAKAQDTSRDTAKVLTALNEVPRT